MTIRDICASFDIGGQYLSCKEITTGNINKTYAVKFLRGGQEKEYVIQKINKNVFKSPEKVMNNIVRVTNYIKEKVEYDELSAERLVLRAFTCKEDNKPFVIDDKGDYWRCYRFIKNSITYDTCDDLSIIERAGVAFGKFQRYLDGFDANSLHITIPNFHNTVKRFNDLRLSIEQDKFGRVNFVKEEIQDLLALEQKACLLHTYLESGKIPIRVTHNDTKCNNVSFDKDTGEALAVLDLDTVMPGAVAFDFGDAIRFIANTVIEDHPDVSAVALDLEKYTAFAKGFVGEVCTKLAKKEIETLNLGVLTMAAELASRFLADYIEGDVYFKTLYPGHNLDRARNQIALAKDIDKKLNQMDEILKKYI